MTARKRTSLHVYAELKPALQWVEELFRQTVCAPQHQCFSSDFLARIKVFLVKETVDAFAGTVFLAKEVAKQIESEMEYPGQIKVNVVRELRSTEYAK